ncbi:MAG: class I SAM-dependent methyltransferase [Elusimicrobia bacterium]|nr:class I SAM-dependent methyltransferase [Elusimicrobiota bacterium]
MPLISWIHDHLTRRKMERLFARGEDPYRYRTSSYEQARFQKTVEVLRDRRFHRILEVGCGEGVLSRDLVQRTDVLVALDISAAALERARVQLDPWKQRVQFVQGNIRKWIQDCGHHSFDLIVLSEVLYYLGEKEQKGTFLEFSFLDFLKDVSERLGPEGWILLAHGFCNPRERKIREGYGQRLAHQGLRLKGEWVAGEFEHDKGSARCLIQLFSK